MSQHRLVQVLAVLVLVGALIGFVSWLVMPPDWTGHPQHKTEGKMASIESGEMAPIGFSMLAVPWWSLVSIVIGTFIVYGLAWEVPTFPEKSMLIPASGFITVHFLSAVLDYGSELITGGEEMISPNVLYGVMILVMILGFAANRFELGGIDEEVTA